MTYKEKFEEKFKIEFHEESCVFYDIGESHRPEWCGEEYRKEDCKKCWDREFPNNSPGVAFENYSEPLLIKKCVSMMTGN